MSSTFLSLPPPQVPSANEPSGKVGYTTSVPWYNYSKAVDTELRDLSTQVDTVTTQLSTVSAHLSTLTTLTTALQTSVDTLNNLTTALQTSFNNLRTSFDNLETSFANLQTSFANLQTTFNDIIAVAVYTSLQGATPINNRGLVRLNANATHTFVLSTPDNGRLIICKQNASTGLRVTTTSTAILFQDLDGSRGWFLNFPSSVSNNQVVELAYWDGATYVVVSNNGAVAVTVTTT